MTIIQVLKKIWGYLPKRYRYYIFFLLVLMIFSGIFEFASIGVVIPFMGVLLSPEKVLEYALVDQVFAMFSISGREETIIFLTLLFMSMVLVSALLRSLLLWANLRISHVIGGNFENEVYRHVLYQPYETHVQQNISDVIDGVGKAGTLTSIILGFLGILYGFVLMTSMLFAILVVDIYVSFGVFFTVSMIYILIMYLSRAKIKKNGEVLARLSNIRLRLMQESFGGIRDILLEGRQEQYFNYSKQIVYQEKQAARSNLLVGHGPRLVIEPLAILIITALASFLALSGDFETQMPIFIALAFTAQRLLPTMQSLFSGWTSMKTSIPLTLDVFKLLDQPIKDEFLLGGVIPLEFKESLRFEDVSFRYRGMEENVLHGVSFEIEKSNKIGIIGRTGSGKSTILDLLLGLLVPTEGEIKVDGKLMSDDVLQKWQRAVAYVPQDTFFADTTISQNIAFGIEQDDIDIERVQDVVRLAQLDDMISSLPEGLNTIIGENGRMVSGGQRQRVGIARALYKQASVLILDEATSALDIWTEGAVIDRITGSDITLIIVTHRLSTLENCDIVYVLDEGKVVASGSYQDIMKSDHLPSIQDGSEVPRRDSEYISQC